jgi:hypothetical protein
MPSVRPTTSRYTYSRWPHVAYRVEHGDTCGGCLKRIANPMSAIPDPFRMPEQTYYADEFYCVRCRRTLPCCRMDYLIPFCGGREGLSYTCGWCAKEEP